MGLGVSPQLCRTGDNPFAQWDGSAAPAGGGGADTSAISRSSGLGSLWHTAPLDQADGEFLGSLKGAGLHILHTAGTALLPIQPGPPELHQPEGDFIVQLYQEQEGRGQKPQEQLALPSDHTSQLGGELSRAFCLETQEALECCRTLSTSLTHQLCSSTHPAQPCRQPRRVF